MTSSARQPWLRCAAALTFLVVIGVSGGCALLLLKSEGSVIARRQAADLERDSNSPPGCRTTSLPGPGLSSEGETA